MMEWKKWIVKIFQSLDFSFTIIAWNMSFEFSTNQKKANINLM